MLETPLPLGPPSSHDQKVCDSHPMSTRPTAYYSEGNYELITVKLGRHPAGRHPVMLRRSIPLISIYPENPTAFNSSVFHEGGALSTSECETSQLRIRA